MPDKENKFEDLPELDLDDLLIKKPGTSGEQEAALVRKRITGVAKINPSQKTTMTSGDELSPEKRDLIAKMNIAFLADIDPDEFSDDSE